MASARLVGRLVALAREPAGGCQRRVASRPARTETRDIGRPRPAGVCHDAAVRRSIDDHPFTEEDLPPSEDDLQRLSWAVAISDDYEDAEPRVVLTVEEVGNAGAGLILHLTPTIARRLRVALRDALREIGEDPGR